MKRILLLFILMVALLQAAVAKDDEPSGNIKKWSSGKLDWSDFQTIDRSNDITSQMRGWISIDRAKEKKGSVSLLRPSTFAYIDRNFTWVNPDDRNDQLLRYHQAAFDLLEVYRRRFQRELDKSISQTETDSFHRHYMKSYEDEVAKMRSETAEGVNLSKMEEWEQYIQKELNSEAETKAISYSPLPFGYGLNLGVGYIYPTGTLADAFSPAVQFVIGLDFSYNRFHLFSEVGIGQVKNEADILITGEKNSAVWRKNKHTDFSTFHLGLGYDIINNARFRLAPFAGMSVTDYSNVKKEEGKDKINMHILDLNASFGICFDYKFSTIASITPSFWLGHREMLTSAIRTKLFVGMANYDSFAKGALIGISVSYSCSGRMIRVR